MPTRAAQIDDTRSLIDEPSEAFILDSEIVSWLNQADQIFATEVEPIEYSANSNVVNGQRSYSMPGTIIRVKAVYYNGNLIDPFDLLDEAVYTNNGIANATAQVLGQIMYWRHFGNSILLFPTPSEAVTNGLKVVYFGTPPSIGAASSTATSQIPANYHDASPYYAAFKSKLKRQQFDLAKAFKDLYSGRIQDAKRQWNPRDRAGFQHVRDEDDLNHNPIIAGFY